MNLSLLETVSPLQWTKDKESLYDLHIPLFSAMTGATLK